MVLNQNSFGFLRLYCFRPWSSVKSLVPFAVYCSYLSLKENARTVLLQLTLKFLWEEELWFSGWGVLYKTVPCNQGSDSWSAVMDFTASSQTEGVYNRIMLYHDDDERRRVYLHCVLTSFKTIAWLFFFLFYLYINICAFKCLQLRWKAHVYFINISLATYNNNLYLNCLY